VPGTRREVVVFASLPPKEEEGGFHLNDMWNLRKCDSKDS
jgi:hypothetical protein